LPKKSYFFHAATTHIYYIYKELHKNIQNIEIIILEFTDFGNYYCLIIL